MRKTFFILSLLLSVAASANTNIVTMEQIQTTALNQMLVEARAMIDWKVGDNQNFKVTLEGMGMEGTMSKSVTKEEGNGVWIKQALKLPIMNDTSELLIDRDTGKVTKYIHNGKEEAVPAGDITIDEQETAKIDVPAGSFDVMHITAHSKDIKKIEIWANPNAIALDGAAKLYMDQGQVKISMVLTSFKKQ